MKIFNEFRDDYKLILDAVYGIQDLTPTSFDSYYVNTCVESNKSTPTECYECINGPIKYTRVERTRWENLLKDFVADGVKFNPNSYHKYNMISVIGGSFKGNNAS